MDLVPCVVDTSAWIEWLADTPTGWRLGKQFPEKSHCIVPTVVQLELSKWLVREVGEEQADQVIAYTRTTHIPDPDVKAIRETTGLSQSQFALMIRVKLKTLQNWEQKRVRPAGPARALLQIVAVDPHAAIRAFKGLVA